jgi:hypothetical protein
MVKAKIGPSLCPDCYLFDGVDTPLLSRQGATLRCERGHTWSGNDHFADHEILEQRQSMARHKRSEMAKKENPELQEPQAPVTLGPAPHSDTGTEIIIDKESHGRISSIVGDFGDAATLYGVIFSMAQDMKTLQDELRIAQKAPSVMAIKDANDGLTPSGGGDLPVTVLIPERHVTPIKDIAEANGCSVPDYVNAIVTNGCDANWFY